MKIAIIGAGAAGCFCAIELGRRLPEAEITVLEAGQRPLAKVALTGGGRCNLTNSFALVHNLRDVYPRGEQLMKRGLRRFSQDDTWRWFEKEGVKLVLQEDQCVFPYSQDAMQIVRTLLARMREAGVRLECSCRVMGVAHEGESYRVTTAAGVRTFDCVVVTTGGSPRLSGLDFLAPLQLDVVEPVPSLFTFRLAGNPLGPLMGLVVQNAVLSIPGTRMRAAGPLLITDWGLSGPAALKLSSFAARHLASAAYTSPLLVDWSGGMGENAVRSMLEDMLEENSRKTLGAVHPPFVPSRLFRLMLERCGLKTDSRCSEVGPHALNRMVAAICCDSYSMSGRAAFKEEFVTCGGVALSNIDISTLESRKHPGLLFAGEVLDVDAVTGGFNLQAAWTMGFIAASTIADRYVRQ